jgi:hypothetical protein
MVRIPGPLNPNACPVPEVKSGEKEKEKKKSRKKIKRGQFF